MESIYSYIYIDLGSTLDVQIRQILQAIYFSLGVSHQVINFVIVYVILSGILFEKILVNKTILPIWRYLKYNFNYLEKFKFQIPEKNPPYDKTKVYEQLLPAKNDSFKSEMKKVPLKPEQVTFWFNDWLYQYRGYDEFLDDKERFIPIFRSKRFTKETDYTENFYTPNEQELKSKIKPILLRSMLWSLLCTSISLPLELFGNSLPFRLFVLFCFYAGPTVIWEKNLSRWVDTTYIMKEFRTPRIQMVLVVIFYVVPTSYLLQGEISQLYYNVILPYTQNHDPELGKLMNRYYRKIIRFFKGITSFWIHVGAQFATLLAIIAVLDNWWESTVLPRFEKPGSYQEFEVFLLDTYRIRNTDRLVATYPYLVMAVDLFGRYWYKIWRIKLYNFYYKMNLLAEQLQEKIALSEKEFTQMQIPHFLDLNGVIIEQKNPIATVVHEFSQLPDQILLSIAGRFNSQALLTIDTIGLHFHDLHSAWPGMSGFLLAMLFRGMRYKGPDTYPNFGDAPPDLATRNPLVVFNKDYDLQSFARLWKATPEQLAKILSAEEKKFIQFPPRCGWQKYFVRWNWTLAFTISLTNAVVYRGIIKQIVGSASWKLIQVEPSTMASIRDGYVNLQASVWLFGFICSLIGISAIIPGTYQLGKYHCGRMIPVNNRFMRTIEKNKNTPLTYYPYDVIEIKKAVNSRYPETSIPRLKKLWIFLQVQIETLKKIHPTNILNLFKWLLILLVLLIFSNTI